MATFNKAKLSGSTDGKGIKVAATATPGTAVHTAVAGTGDDNFDELYLYAMNTDTVARKLTVEFGGAVAPDNLLEVTIDPEAGLVPVVPGLPLQNAATVGAFAETANVIVLYGFVNKVRV